MKLRSVLRLEWISLVYLGLFVLAVLSPSLVTQSFFGIQERHIEEVLIFLFGIVGLTIFSIYQRLMERHEREHEDAKNEYERAKRELVDSYKYIGAINRQIEVLKRVTNQTSISIMESDHLAKDLLSTLLASAATSVDARAGFIRFIELKKLRTEYEMAHPGESEGYKIANKDLFTVHETGISHAIIKAETGENVLVVPSDRKDARSKAYLLLVAPKAHTTQIDPTLLKVFANQAELLRHTLARHMPSNATPLELVRETERQAVGIIE